MSESSAEVWAYQFLQLHKALRCWSACVGVCGGSTLQSSSGSTENKSPCLPMFDKHVRQEGEQGFSTD